ncbi:hypothetical protein EDB84DRAFT_1437472 [Lactarius hengduanensis]|nr:hypothetical protein EDB84DRAFT_1437472 [Lactarius hengduanensis]
MSVHIDQSTTGAVRSGALEAFEHSQKSLIALCSTWAGCPLRSKTVFEWLSRFYRAWDHLESMSRFAGVSDVGARPRALRAEIEEGARPYAELGWLVTFPRVATPDQDRLIQFYGVLERAYFSAFVLGPSPTGDDPPVFDFAYFKWCEAKLARVKAEYLFERNFLSQIPGPSSVTQRRGSARVGSASREGSVPPAYEDV